MLKVLRFSGVLKKLQLNDLTKFLIGRLAAVERARLEHSEVAAVPSNRVVVEQLQQQQRLPNQQTVVESSQSHSTATASKSTTSMTTSSSSPATTAPQTSSSRNFHSSRETASSALVSVSGGLAFGNSTSSRNDLVATARVHQQQTVARELEDNIDSGENCDQVGKMSTENHQSEASALKAAAAAAAAASTSTSSQESPCPSTSSPGDVIKFLELVGDLKHIKRTGWVMRDVKDCESISGHMYRMGMMTYLLDGKDGLDRTKCLELAMIHDLAECIVGDLTPFCGVSREEKKLRELRAMEDICKLIQPYGRKVLELFQEYENAETAESKFVKDLDRLDMVLQAFEYEKRDNCVLKHQEFFDSTDGKFGHPRVRELIDEINAQRRLLAIEKEQRKLAAATTLAEETASNMNGSVAQTTTNGFAATNGHQDDDMAENNHISISAGAKKVSSS